MKYVITLFALGALLALFIVSTAKADIFAYKTEDGVFAYTDDIKKVPERYRASAKAKPSGKSQAMFTVVAPDADLVTMRQRSRLEALRKSNEADRQAARAERVERAKAAAAAKPQTTIIVIQPRVERHGFPQRQRQGQHYKRL